MTPGFNQDWINSQNWGGFSSVNEAKKHKAEKEAKRSNRDLEAMASSIRGLHSDVGNLDSRMKRIEDLLCRSVLIQEKQLLAVNALLPNSKKVVALSSDEVLARQTMGFSVFEVLNEKVIHQRYRQLAKQCHPDVDGVDSDTEFLILESATELLLNLVRN